MTGAGFVLAINFGIAALFAAIFAWIAAYDPAYRSARWFTGVYLLGLITVSTEFLLPFQVEMRALYLIGFASLLAAQLAGSVGFSRRYAADPPWTLLLSVFVVSVTAVAIAYQYPRDSFVRMFAYQTPLAVAQGIAAVVLLRCGRRNLLDRTIAVVLVLGSLTFLARPFLALSLGGTGATPSAYIGTAYAAYSQTIAALCIVTTGMLVAVAYVQDILRDLRNAAELDPLSRLSGRVAFEARARAVLSTLGSRSAALIVADLDGLHAINTRHGYEAGDRVIAAFADEMRRLSSVDHVLGRIGGDQFVILLAEDGPEGARRFAEALTRAFAEQSIEGVGRDLRQGASFGIAERGDGMPLEILMKRAADALGCAKKQGPNGICVATIEGAPIELHRQRQFRAPEG